MSGWVAGAIVVSSVIGSNASNKAASAQAQAAEKAGDLSLLVAERQIEAQEKQFAASGLFPWPHQ